jgi:citrate lyase subunit beta/citryl-CoA lyase
VSHPRDVLQGTSSFAPLPVCDHYCGVEALMVKSLALQVEYIEEFGHCVFDVTLDCEDGAPVGAEKDHASMIRAIVNSANGATYIDANSALSRVAVRIHPFDHPAFADDVEIIVGGAGKSLCHVMIPKVESVVDLKYAIESIDRASVATGRQTPLPIHVLIESPSAVQAVADIVSHPRVESASFGLMDFVSAHGGLIPAAAMSTSLAGVPDEVDQFSHPLVVRAKLEISAACHAFKKVASHCVVTEFKDARLLEAAARHASRRFGFGRMWSIHPEQIRPILKAFAPEEPEVERASKIVCAALAANWAPISFDGKLHDRASYRYFWQTLVRAHQTAKLHPEDPAQIFFNLE